MIKNSEKLKVIKMFGISTGQYQFSETTTEKCLENLKMFIKYVFNSDFLECCKKSKSCKTLIFTKSTFVTLQNKRCDMDKKKWKQFDVTKKTNIIMKNEVLSNLLLPNISILSFNFKSQFQIKRNLFD